MSEDIFATAESIANNASPPSETSAMPIAPILKDHKGRAFDPSLHHVNADGTPILNADGTVKAKRGRRPGSASHIPTEAPASQAEANAAGAAIAESIFMLCRGLGGEAFTPIQRDGIDERAMMISAWQRYCDVKGIKEIPPGMFVCIAMTNYIAPRFTEPTVRARIGGFFARIKNWYRNRRKVSMPDQATPAVE